MFICNEWYGVAWSEDIGRQLTARTVLGEPLVFYRTQGGRVAALLDRCPHRSSPLSRGVLKQDTVECGYHGLTFDSAGVCVRVPGQSRVPAAARVRTFPVTEKYGLVWIWPGDPAVASQSEIAECPYYGESGWARVRGHTRFACNYQTVLENLIDPAHPSFVHKGTIGNAAAEDVPIASEECGDTVTAGRWINDAPAVPMMQRYGKFKGNVDRWQFYHVKTPSVSRTDSGCLVAGLPHGDEQKASAPYRVLSYAAVTPETDRVTHYFWYQTRNYGVDDETVTREVAEMFEVTFEEDKAILEGIQKNEDTYGRLDSFSIASDTGVMRMRRILARRLAAEQEATFSRATDRMSRA